MKTLRRFYVDKCDCHRREFSGLPLNILCAGYSAGQVILLSKQDMLFEELATPKRTTYSYGEALNELWKAGMAEYLKSL